MNFVTAGPLHLSAKSWKRDINNLTRKGEIPPELGQALIALLSASPGSPDKVMVTPLLRRQAAKYLSGEIHLGDENVFRLMIVTPKKPERPYFLLTPALDPHRLSALKEESWVPALEDKIQKLLQDIPDEFKCVGGGITRGKSLLSLIMENQPLTFSPGTNAEEVVRYICDPPTN